MKGSIKLGVYRRLDNRFEGLSDDSPRALELHNRRKNALHEAFDDDPVIQVIAWGDTDDSRPHEYVELLLGAAGAAVFQHVVVPGIKWLGQKLAEKAVDTALSEFAKAIVAKLRPKQESKQLLDFTITMPDGTQIRVDPPDQLVNITISLRDGTRVEYSKAAEQGAS